MRELPSLQPDQQVADREWQTVEWQTVSGPTESFVIELDLPARVDLVAVARMVIVAAARCGDVLEGERLDDLQLLTSEAATNAVEANLATEHPGRVCIEAELGSEGLTLSVSDQGPGLPELPNELSQWAELPDLQAPGGLQHEGGFGLPLMHLLSSQPGMVLSGGQGTTVKLHLSPSSPDLAAPR